MSEVNNRTMSELYEKIDRLEKENKKYRNEIEEAIDKIDAYSFLICSGDYKNCTDSIFFTINETIHTCFHKLSEELRECING